MELNVAIVVLSCLATLATCYSNCSGAEHDRCVRIADPLIREGRLIFPDNVADLDVVCRTWNQFVDCLSLYTEKCFTEQQRRQFNKAVRSPIESVHQMCTDPGYQKEYLQHAPCLKSTITERNHCGLQYNLLVDQVARGNDISKTTICCSYEKFKRCVHAETARQCERSSADGPASRFSQQIIDKSFHFLHDQCTNQIPSSSCVNAPTKAAAIDYFPSPASSEIHPWSSTARNNREEKEQPPLPRKTKPSTTPWLPATGVQFTSADPSPPLSSSDEILSTRTRPSSYGRSSGFDFNTQPMNVDPSANTHDPGFAARDESTRGSSDPSTWVPTRDDTGNGFTEQESSSMTWYPAAGDQIENEVDEPNQQGLIKPDNAAGQLTYNVFAMVVHTVLLLTIVI